MSDVRTSAFTTRLCACGESFNHPHGVRGRPPTKCPACREAARERRRNNIDWKPVITRAAEIVESYDTDVTLRQLFYRLVSEGLIPNLQERYSYLAKLTAEARRDGRFPDLIDRNRKIYQATSYADPRHGIESLVRSYKVDRTFNQDVTIVLAVEKAGLVVQLSKWFGEFGVPIVALSGYASEPYIQDIRARVDRDDRPAVLLYAGDLDPSGEDIFRNFRERTRWSEVRHVALTPGQVEAYGLVRMPGKDSDTRSAKFVERHGELFQVEVDALPPETLRELFEEEFFEFWDTSKFEEMLDLERIHRDELAALTRR